MVTGAPVSVIVETQEKMSQTLGLFSWLFIVNTRFLHKHP